MPPRAESVRRVLDVVVPVGVALFQAMVVLAPDRTDGSWLTLLGVMAAAISGAALVWRHHRPVLALAVAAAGGVVLQLLAPETIFPVAALVAMWSLAVVRPPLWSLPGLAVVLGVTALSLPWAAAEDVWFGMAVAVAVWALAEAVRSRRRAIVEASRRAVGEEQARIARELHDVIAHSVSVIVVQAAAADDVFDARPDQARSALRSIEAAGREALGELRQLLGAVSAPRPEVSAAVPSAAAPSAAAPSAADGSSRSGLAWLAELTVPLRAAGLEVAVRDSSRSRVLPAAVDLSAYRIVQEALTNTLRHAHATRASVTIREVGGALEVDVSGAGGRGLTGMRERAALLGGTLDAGPLPEGGFRVRARLPLEPAR